MIDAHYLEDALRQLHKLRALADGAIAQISEEDLFRELDPESNSIAIIIKHMSGNMRSRWRDFLTSDGEKPDRNRDSEFVIDPAENGEAILQRWKEAWELTIRTFSELQPTDLTRKVQIRGETHSVLEAINRQLMHYAYHVGQIVYLAKHFAGNRWRSLSIPRGKSKEYEVSKEGMPYSYQGGEQ
jgi:hypothetical protein